MRFSRVWLAGALLLLAACSAKSPAPVADGPKAGPNCTESTTDARHFTFGPGKLVGMTLGKGTTGVVLAHQNGGSVCQWLITAKDLSSRGYLVLAFDFHGFGASPLSSGADLKSDVEEAVKAIRAAGATKVVLIGASMGGTASLAAAATIAPPVTAVVSLSAPASFGAADADSAAAKLTMPVLYVCGSGESTYAEAARKMHAASKASSDAQLLIADGTANHGVSLVIPDVGHPAAIAGVNAFLEKNARP